MLRFTTIAAAMTIVSAPAPDALASPGASANLLTAQVAAAPQGMAKAQAVAAAAADLKAGAFHWAGDAGGGDPLLIAVSVADQKLYAYRAGALFAVSTVSTGRRGHETPLGVFPIMEKRR